METTAPLVTRSVDVSRGRLRIVRRSSVLLGVAASVLVLMTGTTVPAGTRQGLGMAQTDASSLRGLSSLPLAARALVSRTVAEDDPSYRVTTSPRGLTAANRSQGLTARFTERGVEVRSGAGRVALRLAAYGRGQALRPVAAVAPSARANRVEYQRGGVVEWYTNGPLGLEQGFTLTSRPTVAGSEPLTLSLDLSGNLSASLEGQQVLALVGAGASLRYAGLVASDALGRDLSAWLELRGPRVFVRVADAGARYPLTVDPLVQQAKLTASDGAPYDHLGFKVAVSGDTLVVGAPHSDVGANADQGAVYVFVTPANGWASGTETAKLTASDGAAGDLLGWGVAISGDTVVAGAPGAAFTSQGSAYLFVKPADGWASRTQTGKLTASDAAPYDHLGVSVAVSGDTVVASAAWDRFGADGKGAVYVFVKPADGWASGTETAKLTASDGAEGDLLGEWGLAVSGDTVAAGASEAAKVSGGDTQHGSVYVFVKPADGWASATETAKLTASDGAFFDLLGWGVAVSDDTVVAGAYQDDVGANIDQGSVYVFVKPAEGWASGTETAKLTASDGAAGDLLGWAVALSGDTLVASAYEDDVGDNDSQGSVYVFVKPADGWASGTETAKLTASDGARWDLLGVSVAVSGETVVAGAWWDDVGANVDQGSAYVFGPNRPPRCTGMSAAPNTIQPATSDQMMLISLGGATDPDGDPLSFHIDAVTQDEPVSALGDDTFPDAALTEAGATSNQVWVRAERNPKGDGRVYRIAYTVSDGHGGNCSGTAGVGGNTNVEVSVPRKKGQAAIDGGDTNSWDSFTGTQVSGTLP